MGIVLRDDLLDQFLKAISMVRFTIGEFEEKEWMTGVSWFQTPARIGWHIVETLDFYFSGKRNAQEFKYGYRFADLSPWELPDEQMPKQEAVLEYLDEMEAKIKKTFASLGDEDLDTPFELYDWSGKTLLGHYVYAQRHTMEHHGALTVLATSFGHTEESWT
ncbi:MAG: DinB family protein [Chloroflexi bacterium]|nr:DinB family protein [Chloroflexota bacterium]